MSKKIEGKISFAGLLEGRLAGKPGLEARLQAWVREAADAGLAFDLKIDGDMFSLMPGSGLVEARVLGPEPHEALARALTSLMQSLPAECRAEAFSTLRSTEIRPGCEVQGVYVLADGGRVEARTRDVDATTSPRVQPATFARRARMALVAVLMVGVVIGIASLFVDWGAVLGRLANEVAPLGRDEVSVDLSRFSPWLELESHEVQRGSRAVTLVVRMKAGVPGGPYTSEPVPPDLPSRFAWEALYNGYVRAEIFSRTGEFLGCTDIRVPIRPEEPTARLVVTVPRDPRPARIVLRP